MKKVWCPDCKYFGLDCYVDEEDYGKPCDSFELKRGLSEGEELNVLHDAVVIGEIEEVAE